MKSKAAAITLLILSLLMFTASAQDSTSNTISFNGFSFSYDPAVATSVNIWQYPAESPEQGPYWAEPQHIQFGLYSQLPAPESTLDSLGAIHVYKTADFNGYTLHQERIQQLQTLLQNRPDLASYMEVSDGDYNPLPFLPNFPAGQIIRARAQYVETNSLTGISYVTIYREDVFPFLSNEFLYTFQGVSKDGTYYVSMIVPLTTDLFPAEIGSDFDFETFRLQLNDYMKDSTQKLNDAASDAFKPALPLLDSMVQSIAFSS